MEIPQTILLGGKRIRIKVAEMEDAYGQFDGDKMVITLSTEIVGNPKQVISILRHEMLHAHFFITGQTYAETFNEESVVRAMENIFFPAYEKVIEKMTARKQPRKNEVNRPSGPQPE